MRRAARGWGAAALLLVLAVEAAARLVPLPGRLAMAGSPVLTWADGSAAHVALAPDDRWRIPVRPEEVDPDYLRALLAFEDARFRWHPGVDPLAVLRAAWTNLAAGRVVSGASTLTMQVVRMVEPRPRTLRSKAVEALRAVQLELRLGKDDILAAYLSFAPYGRNLEGVEAAAWACLGHSARHLDAAEIALLLAIPQDPSHRYPRPDHADALRAARDAVARRLAAVGALPTDGRPVEAVLAEVLARPVPERLRPLPRALPHVAAWLDPAPGTRTRLTLDPGVQALAERVVAAARPAAARVGIDNAAVVVVEHATGEVKALVGNFDPAEAGGGRWIPAFAVPRSPGSALKPFLLARAIGDGRVLPGFLVPDIPVRYGGWSPANYDGGHDGMVTLADALSRSLNIPFVNLLHDVGVERFLGTLRRGGAAWLDPRPGAYGLSAIVGGVAVSPLEMARLYAALAEDGANRPLRLRSDDPPGRAAPWLEPGAAWMVRRVLRWRDRPDFPARKAVSAMPRGIHWKTGTSQGNRDAWAVGSGRRYTAVVWMGNLDNRPSPGLVGAAAAGPLLFDLLEGLDDGLRADDAPPDDVGTVEVCALSGRLAGKACPHRRRVPALVARVPPERCELHVRVEIDEETGLRVRPGCRAGRRTRVETRVVWPAGVRRWLAAGRAGLEGVPPWAPGCAPTATAGPRIVTPEAGAELLLVPGMAADRQEVALRADGSGRLSWFVDGALLARVPAEEAAWWRPRPGRHEILVLDGGGRSDRRELRVRALE